MYAQTRRGMRTRRGRTARTPWDTRTGPDVAIQSPPRRAAHQDPVPTDALEFHVEQNAHSRVPLQAGERERLRPSRIQRYSGDAGILAAAPNHPPSHGSRSTSSTRCPSTASPRAVSRPAGPAPTTRIPSAGHRTRRADRTQVRVDRARDALPGVQPVDTQVAGDAGPVPPPGERTVRPVRVDMQGARQAHEVGQALLGGLRRADPPCHADGRSRSR
jgi:hypothetical protein